MPINDKVATEIDSARWQGCLRCRQPVGLWSDNFCTRCLYVLGSGPTNDEIESVLRAFWDSSQRVLHPDAPRTFPGDVSAKRHYTGPNETSLFGKVKAHIDLAEYVGRSTQLRRAGPGKLKGRCPLHQERTPSFFIFEEKGTWRCFGACANGGDVITFAQALSSLATPLDAAMQLAREFGIEYRTRRKSLRPQPISVEVSG